MGKEWVKTHLGLLSLVPLCLLLRHYPIYGGGMLPGPFETLFDWAGEVGAHAYLFIAGFTINFAPIAIAAGCLDLCPARHTVVAITALIISVCLYNYFSPWLIWLTPVCALICASLASFLYLLTRALRSCITQKVISFRARP